MDKQEAIRLLGGTPTKAAEAIGVTVAAISQWPDVLPARMVDRVQAALWRREREGKKRVRNVRAKEQD